MATKLTPAAFFATYAKAAQDTCHDTGLCASICLAQATIESGWGSSGLAVTYNNFSGIKAAWDWKGKVVLLPTREVINGKNVTVHAAFRHYDSPADYFRGRFAFLKANRRYRLLFQSDDYIAEAWQFQAAGYATDPNYARALIGMVAKYGLTKYDDEVAQPTIKADSARPLTAVKAA